MGEIATAQRPLGLTWSEIFGSAGATDEVRERQQSLPQHIAIDGQGVKDER